MALITTRFALPVGRRATATVRVMTLLIFMIGFGSATVIAVVVGYVIWRDRNRHESFVDPSISRDARSKAELQSLRARERDPFGNDISGI
jgi:hypothetical protein